MKATRGNHTLILSADYEETEWGVWDSRTESIYLNYGTDDPRNKWAMCETYSVSHCENEEYATFIPDPDNDNLAYPCSFNDDGWTLTADMTKPYDIEWGVYDLEESSTEHTGKDETDMSYSIEIGRIIEDDPDKHDIYHVTPYETQPEMNCPSYNLKDIFTRVMEWEFEQGRYYPLTEALEHINHGLDILVGKGFHISIPYSSPENHNNLEVLRHLGNWQECITTIAEERDGDLTNLLFKW